MTRILFAFCLLIFTASAHASQSTPADAERFVQENARSVIASLEDLAAGERDIDSVRAEFRARIDALIDLERITNMVLGRYRRTAPEEDVDEFREVFREYAASVYESELTSYTGQQFEVTGSIERRQGDYIVQSRVYGGDSGQEFRVNWRVMENRAGELRVVDAEVAGVWLALTQREQITGIIGNNRGDVTAATRVLRDRAARGASIEDVIE
jgi:phospholipid transport system substrate-binding protein